MSRKTICAFAPASVANVAVGFDILGYAMDGIGDKVEVSISSRAGTFNLTGAAGVPADPKKNTCTVAMEALVADFEGGLWWKKNGLDVTIQKGIPVASGLGGSAASAVAGVYALNELLGCPYSSIELLRFAAKGEQVASGGIHYDNIAPTLVGGLVLVHTDGTQLLDLVPVPVPKGLFSVVVHPDLSVRTKEARALLKKEIGLRDWVLASSRLGAWLMACSTGDVDRLGRAMKDSLIEPQRSKLIPGFDVMKERMTKLGAVGFSISGSGPSVFAWAKDQGVADAMARELVEGFAREAGVASTSWVGPVVCVGARIL